ncbi:MAG: hypothetical protein ABI325_05555 [Ginsengibacter sp.]
MATEWIGYHILVGGGISSNTLPGYEWYMSHASSVSFMLKELSE